MSAQGSTGAHPVVTVDNVHISANGATRQGSLRLEYVGEFDLRESLVEIGGDVSDFPYAFHIDANNRNLQAFFIPDAGPQEPAVPGMYVRRNGRWERCTMRAGALPTEPPRNDTEYGKSFFTAVQRKINAESPPSETTIQHYSGWLDKLGLKPVKNALFWLKNWFKYVAAHYPIQRRRAAGDDPGPTLPPPEVQLTPDNILFRFSDIVNTLRVTNALFSILQNIKLWGMSSTTKVYVERYYALGSPNYLDFRSNRVDGFLSISLMAYNFSQLRYRDVIAPSFDPYVYLAKNTLVLINPACDEIVVFDDTRGRRGQIGRRYNVAVTDKPELTDRACPLMVGSPDRMTIYHGHFFRRDSDLSTVFFKVIFMVYPDQDTSQIRSLQPDHMVLAPQVGGREFVPYLKEYLESLEQSRVFYDDVTGRLFLVLEAEEGHGDQVTQSITLLLPEPCDINHTYTSERTEDGHVTARYKILSLTYARVFTMQYSLNTLPGCQWTRQPTVWPVALYRPDGTVYSFEDVLGLPLAHQIAAAVLGMASLDKTEMGATEATWMGWRQKFINVEDRQKTFETISGLTDRPSVIQLHDHSRVILIQDRDIYAHGLLGDPRLDFRNYRAGCLALYMDAGGYVVAWDRMGVSFDPTQPREEQLQTLNIETDYLVRPRSSVEDTLNVYTKSEKEIFYVWEAKDSIQPITIAVGESLTKTYTSDSRYEVIKDHAKALVDQWLQNTVGADRTVEQQLCILQALAHTDGVEFSMHLDESDWENDSYPHRFTYMIPDHWPEGVTTLQGVFYKAAQDFYSSAYNDIYPKEGAIAIDRIALSLRVLVKRIGPRRRHVCVFKKLKPCKPKL